MTNIKATHESITRRLNISSFTSWSELESQFHTLFNIPQEVPIAVSYTDEEGDDITLSSDLELQEVLSNPPPNKPIKFVLKTPSEKNSRNKTELIDTMMDEETSSLINGVSAIRIEESNHHNRKHVTIDNRETRGETSKKAAESTNNDDGHRQEEDDDGEPEIIVIIGRNLGHGQSFSGCNSYHPYHNGRRFRHEFSSRRGCNTASRDLEIEHLERRILRFQISNQIMAQKLNLLRSMGFFDDDLKELIKRYDGKLEHVIEVLLLRQRNEQDDEKKKEKEKEVREENDKEFMEVEKESMEVKENNIPYDL